MFNMLKPERCPYHHFYLRSTFDIWKKLAETEKWAPYCQTIETLIPPYQYMSDLVEKVTRALEDTGFVVHVCKRQDCVYTYSTASDLLGSWLIESIS